MNKFILPEFWCVKATTRKEDQILTDYVNAEFGTHAEYDEKDIINTWFTNKDLGEKYYTFSENQPFGTIEITYNQFLKHILGQSIPSEQPEDNTELNQILIKLLTE